jgi:citrate synthase
VFVLAGVIFASTGKDELLETAMVLHDVAMKDEYFIKRKLAPNVDFWWVSFLIDHSTYSLTYIYHLPQEVM